MDKLLKLNRDIFFYEFKYLPHGGGLHDRHAVGDLVVKLSLQLFAGKDVGQRLGADGGVRGVAVHGYSPS